ncbi:MAG: TonB-dependent receptor [Pseudoxanthomonas sp.]
MRLSRKQLSTSIGFTLLCMSVVPCTSALAGERAFNVPSSEAGTALPAFARQAGVQIVAPGELLASVRTPAVQGRLETRVALRQMLAGTGLQVVADDGDTITLTSARPLTAALAGPVPGGAVIAQEAPAAATPQSEVNELDTVTVTTGARGIQRTVSESPTPIDVIGSAELEKTGRPGLLSALNDLVPSFNMPAKSGNGTSYVIATGGLRGLNPDHTLVLVNGKRRHRTASINIAGIVGRGSVPVDMSLIPVSAVDHIEVLRDGAAAQYGSDAIAGVINIILKSDAEGGKVDLMWGQNIDRADGDTTNGSVGKGFALGEDGFLYLAADAKYQQASNRAVPVADSYPLYYPVNGQPDPREGTADRLITHNYGQPWQKGANVSYNAELGLGDDLRAYSFATYSRRLSDLEWSFRNPNAINTIAELYPDGYSPILRIDETDYEFTAGLKGLWGAWDWDLATSYGSNASEREGLHTLNASLGPNSPTEFYLGKLISTDWTNSFDITRGVTLAGRPLQVSLGLQHRYEEYEIEAGEPSSYAAGDYVYPAGHPRAGQAPAPGAQGAITFQPDEAGSLDRHSGAAYADFTWDVADSVSLGLAGRYESFDDSAGDTAVGKFTARWAITPEFALRGAASTGFRAPTLAQALYAATNSSWRTLANGDRELFLAKTLPVDSDAALALGAKPLTPEESTNISLGFTYNPTRNLALSVDAYQIDLDDRISMTGYITGAAVTDILTTAGVVGVDSAQYFTNAIDTRTKGVDVVATWRMGLGDFGRVNWNLGYNYNKTDITRIADNPAALESLGSSYELFDRASRGYLSRTPRTKLLLGGNWALGDFSLNVRVNRFGAFDVLENVAANDEHVDAKWITDLEASYALTERLTWTVGGNNIFNQYPKNIGVVASTGSGYYVTSVPYGFTGGSYYTKLTYTF